MRLKALIFGINGQDGYYLSELLLKQGAEVTGVSRTNTAFTIGDVADFVFVSDLINQLQPDYIFHLAANSTTRHDVVFEHHQTITTGTLNILESVYRHSKHTKVFISGSGLQFVNNDEPINETDAFEARDSYSMCRIQSVYTARYYRSLGVKTYVGYFFNHDSPLRGERHVNKKIVIAAKRIAEGDTNQLLLGDINVKKEFTFAGDIVQAIWLLVNNDNVFEATVGSGKAYSISDWLELCFSHYGLNWRNHVSLLADFKVEYKQLVCDPYTLMSLGWKPAIDIATLAAMMIKHNAVSE